jgi:hypothetical protein
MKMLCFRRRMKVFSGGMQLGQANRQARRTMLNGIGINKYIYVILSGVSDVRRVKSFPVVTAILENSCLSCPNT